MAVINVKSGQTTVRGTRADDEINLKENVGDGIIIDAGIGNDKITVTRGNNHLINAGAGADFVTVASGKNYLINLGTGNDRIDLLGAEGHNVTAVSGTNNLNVNSGSGYVINGGTGVDRLTIKGTNGNIKADLGIGADFLGMATGSGNEIKGGEDNDYFIVSGGDNSTFYGDEGNDTLRLYRGEGHTIYAGAGDDSMLVTEANNSKVYGVSGKNQIMFFGGIGNEYYGGDEKDNITLKNKAEAVKITGGSKATVVNIQVGNKHTVDLSKSVNTVTQIMAGSSTRVTGSAGKDTLRVWGTVEDLRADLGDGNDLINVKGGNGMNLKAGAGNDELQILGGSNSLYYAGEGDDIIKVAGGTNNVIATEAGNDVVKITDGNLKLVDLGDGKDHLEFSRGTAEGTIINGGKDDDEIFVYVAGCTVNGDDGNDTIRVNTSLNDTVHSYINGGDGEDYIYISGRYLHVNAGAAEDRVIFTGNVLGANVNLGSGFDWVESEDKNIVLNRVNIDCASNGSNIILNNKLDNCSITGAYGQDRILLGETPKVDAGKKTGTRNILRSGAGNDEITIYNQEYALIVGGEGRDLLKLYDMSKSVIYGDSDVKVAGQQCDNDTLEIHNVDHSFICGSDGSTDNTTEKNRIIMKNCSENIVFGGAISNRLDIEDTNKSLIMSGSADSSGKHDIHLSYTSEYNLCYSGDGDDTFTVGLFSDAQHNTCITSAGRNIFSVSNGAYNSFIGGTERDFYYVYALTNVRDFNLYKGRSGGDVYHIDRNAKALIDLTGSTDKAYIDITGAKDSEVTIKVDKQNDIMLINDIFVKGTNCTFYFGSTDMNEYGDIRLSYSDMLKESTGKTHTEGSMWHIWNTYYDQMGEQGQAITAADLGPSLNTVLDNVQDTITSICASFAK